MMSKSIQDNWERIQERVVHACDLTGRKQNDVRVVVVSKKQLPELVAEAAECGIRCFGENKVQEAAAKIPLCPDDLEWHLVGHLQSNKTRAAVELFDMIHSIDSTRLLEKVNSMSAEVGRTIPVLLQVNVSGEISKSGLAPEEVPAVLDASAHCMNVDLVGLMTIPPFTPDPADAGPVFARLREWRDVWRDEYGISLEELSMGMSYDFEIAIQEGATRIRVGTALFGERR